MSQDIVVQRIDRARRLLAEAASPSQVKQVVDIASAAATYARRQKLGEEAIGYAHSICVEAMCRLGAMLKATPKASGGEHGGRVALDGSRVEPSNKTPRLADLGLDKKTSMVAQQLASLPAEKVEAIKRREITIAQARKQIAESKRAEDLARPIAVALPAGIYHGDFRQLADEIPDNSVDLIFTDPPYDEDAVQLYEDAARVAARILKPGASMIAYSGQKYLPDVYAGMSKHLRYWWTAAVIHGGQQQLLQRLGIRCGWKPLVWYVKETRGDVTNVIRDTVIGEREKFAHEWQQAQSEAEFFIEKLSGPSALVVDFFLGGGTTAAAAKALGRRFIGFEVNAASVEKSVDRFVRTERLAA